MSTSLLGEPIPLRLKVRAVVHLHQISLYHAFGPDFVMGKGTVILHDSGFVIFRKVLASDSLSRNLLQHYSRNLLQH